MATTRAKLKLTDGERARYINVPKNGPHGIARYKMECIILVSIYRRILEFPVPYVPWSKFLSLLIIFGAKVEK